MRELRTIYEIPPMPRRLDELDKHILYYMMLGARNVPTPTIADEMNVSSGTIWNRLQALTSADEDDTTDADGRPTAE